MSIGPHSHPHLKLIYDYENRDSTLQTCWEVLIKVMLIYNMSHLMTKTNKMICAPSEDQDSVQTGPMLRLI